MSSLERLGRTIERARRWRLTLIASGSLPFIVLWPLSYFAGVLNGDYSPLQETVSRLENGAGGLVAKAAFFTAGAALLAFAFGALSLWVKQREWNLLAGVFLVASMGIAIIALGMIPPLPDAEPGSFSFHYYLAGLIMGSQPFLCFLVAPWFRARGWSRMFIYSLLSGLLIIALGLSPLGFIGLKERLILFDGSLWYAVTSGRLCWQLLRAPGRL